jgi:hypothetical protein
MKRVQRPVILGVQRVLLRSLLFLLYYIGFGLARVVLSVVARRTLHNRPKRVPGRDTYWRECEGYDLNAARLERQS